jgi:ABC-type multidrug transport system ATPase subunit
VWNNGLWSIENLSNTSTVTVNQNNVQRAPIQHNSTISLGNDTSFVFFTQASSPSKDVEHSQTAATPAMPPVQTALLPRRVPLPAGTQPSRTLPLIQQPPMLSEEPADKTMIEGMPSLEVSSNIHREKQKHHLLKSVINIGRNPTCDIIINEPIVSGMHAQIVRKDKQWILVHPHPTRGNTLNGLLYQGRVIKGNEQFCKPLTHGDIFRIGDEHGTLVTLHYEAGTDIPLETLPAMEPVPLHDDRLTIGRASDNMLVLSHPQISAHHAMLEKVEGGYRIIDTNSTNHVYVNEDLITNQVLRTGDDIRIGPYRLTYTGTELRPYDESSHIRIDALGLTKMGNNAMVLLNDISLVIPPRMFVAIVGGSGAGKSMLMNALSGLHPARGTVLYNGVNYYRNRAAFSTQLGYVPQDDIVHRDLTVERALYYGARLRLPGDFSREQIQWRVDEVLADVEMTERRNLLVSKLSGGQRKRVSIALELLVHPGVFFLDEPTSGLDPGLDRKMMSLLRRLADKGHTIVLVTHATNNINSCDYVCFLAQGGRLVYFGPPDEAKTYFEKTDFAEIYSTLEPSREHPDIPRQAEARFLGSTDYQRYVANPLREGQVQTRSAVQPVEGKTQKRVKHGNPWSQFMLLSMRYLELLKNDVGNLLILLLQAPIIAIILVVMVRFALGAGVFDADKMIQCNTEIATPSGPLALPQAQKTGKINCKEVQAFLKNDPKGQSYAQAQGGPEQALQNFIQPGPGAGANAQKVLFIMVFGAVLFGCINGAREIVKEAAIYKRERTVNLGIVPYMFSKIAVLSLLCLLQSAVLVFVVELGEPLQQGVFWHPLLETYITIALTSLAGLMIGLTISSIAPNTDRAISFVPIVLIPQVIFSGAIIPFKDWSTQILSTIFPTRWAMAALGTSIGLHSDKIEGDNLFGDDPTFHGTLFSIYSQTDALQRLLLSWAALGAIIILLMILVGIFLKLKDVRTY